MYWWFVTVHTRYIAEYIFWNFSVVSNYPFLKIYVTKVSQLFSNEQHVGVLENQPSSNSYSWNSVDEKIAIAIALLVFQQLVCDPIVTDSLAVIVQKVQNLIYWVQLVRSVPSTSAFNLLRRNFSQCCLSQVENTLDGEHLITISARKFPLQLPLERSFLDAVSFTTYMFNTHRSTTCYTLLL